MYIILPVLIALVLTTQYIRTCSYYKTENPRDVFVVLNEPVFPDNPLINTLTYNSLNDFNSTKIIIETKSQEEAVLKECKINYNNMLSRVGRTPEENRVLNLRNLTCIHYKGALFQDNYWALQGIDAIKIAQANLVNTFRANNEEVRATIFKNFDFKDFSLANLRNADFYKKLDSKKVNDLLLFCQVYLKNTPVYNYFSPDYDFGSASNVVALESCMLVNFFYQENNRVK